MPYVDFFAIQALKPAAFKLYVYWLHRAEQTGTHTGSLSLAQLGRESGLQVHPTWRYPAAQHGMDGTVRRALAELITHGFLEKTGQRGRCPNTYRLLKTPEQTSRKDTAEKRGERRGETPHKTCFSVPECANLDVH